jgi:two-component system, OmpR family, sensor kinase
LPIRWRLTLFIAVVIGAILVLLGLTLFLLLRAALFSDVEDAARGRAEAVAFSVDSGEDPEKDVQESALEGIPVTVRDENGEVLSQTANLSAGENATDTVWRRALETGESASGEADLSPGTPGYVHAVPVDPPSGPARVVEAGKPYEPAEETLEVFGVVLAAGIGSALLLSIAGAYFLAWKVLRPVDVVVSTAREIGESDLAKRLPVANPGDEIGRLTTTINSLLARLEAAFARREEVLGRQRSFAADASHELRTPLTSIGGHARMLDEWAFEDPKMAKRSAAIIRRETGRMRNLVEDLLALARGDESAPMQVDCNDLAGVAREAVEATRAAAEGKVSVKSIPSGQKIEAVFDRDRVRQAATILLDNAIKYTPQGGSVAVRVEERDGWAALEVSDTGTGIPENELPLIFERFHRADPSRAEGGAGLGLSIARQIVRAHGGKIEVESEPGEGSTFVLRIPQRGLAHRL